MPTWIGGRTISSVHATSSLSMPRIGLTTYRERAAWGVWNEPADLLPVTYSDAVTRAGGVALLLPPSGNPAAASDALDGLHGLVLAGGADVDPARYGAERDAHTGAARRDRDAWELALAEAALARNLPVLAICRGIQVLNVLLGGDLVQHLPDAIGNDSHAAVVGEHGRHGVRVDARSRLAAVLGERRTVATYHHQALDRLGAGLTAVAWADDGTVEAVELAAATWTFGVQWHPEAHDGAALFAAFVSAAAAFAARTDRANV
jgi:gamma-glutamyl-gamma-aminobutyrate hydrolase PuuD